MSQAEDCALLGAAFGAPLPANCCSLSTLAGCDSDGRITTVSAICSSGEKWFGGTFPQGLEKLPGLGVIFLDGCQLTGPLPDTFDKFPSLYQLHLQGNNLEGPIPPSFSGMVNMQYFHIQNNKFIGTLPDLSGWKLLQVAEVDGNCLTGSSTNPKISLAGQTTGCPTSWNPLPPPGNPLPADPTTDVALSVQDTAAAVSQTSGALTAKTSTKTNQLSSVQATTTPTTDNSSSSSSESLSMPMIGGIAGGAVVLLILVAVGVFCCVKKRQAAAGQHIMLDNSADGSIPYKNSPKSNYNADLDLYEMKRQKANGQGQPSRPNYGQEQQQQQYQPRELQQSVDYQRSPRPAARDGRHGRERSATRERRQDRNY
ncbi:UNVERIFIED_CONTAM: hypothetical protein HDU68_007599 [Siphonaria sp. JEL0065]|nr:hypothetical protein HDU68_007599 [Siphonaria sp. JEL0065]